MFKKKLLIAAIFAAVFFTIGISVIYGHRNDHKLDDNPPKTKEIVENRTNFITSITPASEANDNMASSTHPGNRNETDSANSSKEVPVLMYHSIEDEPWGLEQLFVRTSEFEKQIRYLSENGYTPLFFEDLKNCELYHKPILITFDDGYSDNYYNAYPILKKYNFKSVIFLIVNSIDLPNFLTREQIKEMSDIISFQSHTLNHYELDKISGETLENECVLSKKKIEEITGKSVIALSYPGGRYKQHTIDAVSKYYEYAVTTQPGFYSKNSNNYQIKRIRIQRSDTLQNFISKLH